jgi:hypothetical protein
MCPRPGRPQSNVARTEGPGLAHVECRDHGRPGCVRDLCCAEDQRAVRRDVGDRAVRPERRVHLVCGEVAARHDLRRPLQAGGEVAGGHLDACSEEVPRVAADSTIRCLTRNSMLECAGSTRHLPLARSWSGVAIADIPFSFREMGKAEGSAAAPRTRNSLGCPPLAGSLPVAPADGGAGKRRPWPHATSSRTSQFESSTSC